MAKRVLASVACVQDIDLRCSLVLSVHTPNHHLRVTLTYRQSASMDAHMHDRTLDELRGSVGRVFDGTRSAAFNGGRAISESDVLTDKVRLWLCTVLPSLPQPKPKPKQLLEMESVMECASCPYEGRLLKSGETLRVKKYTLWKPEYFERSKRWCSFAHGRNC